MLILPLGDEPDFARIAPKYIDFLNFFQISNFDESLVLNQYEPQDAGSLRTMYCNILKQIQPVDRDLFSQI